MDRDDLGDAWRSEILAGLSSIPYTGAVPGGIVVWGTSARPILLSGEQQNKKTVLIAAAQMAKGRILAIAHEGLVKNSTEISLKLLSNIKNWLTNKTEQQETRQVVILDAQANLRNIQPNSLLIWWGSRSLGGITETDVFAHVRNGGSLLHAMCPWGWLQLNPGKQVCDMPLMDVLEESGIYYTDECSGIPHCGLDISNNVATVKDHLEITLKSLFSEPQKLTVTALNDITSLDVGSLPLSVLSKIPSYPNSISEFQQLLQVLGTGLDAGIVQHDPGSLGGLQAIAPIPGRPVRSQVMRAIMSILEHSVRMHAQCEKLPGIEVFPGDFTEAPPIVCHEVEVTSKLRDIHPTGYYLPARGTLTIRILDIKDEGWKVRVGCHTDNLGGLAELRRWPKITEVVDVMDAVRNGAMEIYSPFGGLVYLESPDIHSHIKVCLGNVVEAPIFDMTDQDSIAAWPRRKHSPGLWADIIGKFIIITLPSSSIRESSELIPVMLTWDRVVAAHHDLRGTDPSRHRRQWVVTDEQPVAGYMHAGYPIVTHLDVAQPTNKLYLLNNASLLTTGNWGMFHEIGHNMQRSCWTFEGTGEVTCNIFTLHAMDVVSNKPVWIHEWLSDQMKKVRHYVTTDTVDFSDWQRDPGVALFIYAQIVQKVGWEVYKQVFRIYEEMPESKRPGNDQDKIDTWFCTMSEVSGHNMVPLGEFWKIPISSSVKAKLLKFPPFFPRDEVTSMNEYRSSSIMQKYISLQSCD